MTTGCEYKHMQRVATVTGRVELLVRFTWPQILTSTSSERIKRLAVLLPADDDGPVSTTTISAPSPDGATHSPIIFPRPTPVNSKPPPSCRVRVIA